MENEKYGIELEAKTSKFKSAFKELSDMIKNFGKEAKEETSISKVINPDISKKELLKWREDLENSIKETKLNLNAFRGTSSEKYYVQDLEKYEEGLNLVNNRIQEIDESEKEVNEDLKQINQTSSRSTLGKLFDDSIRKIKHFTYYLLGARSVFSLFMKYQSIYYQYNQKMQYQSELSQNAIALSLAPAFEFLGNVVAYASIGIAKFIELLTGVNVLSKVSTKGIRDYNKSLKQTQTLLSGIDEVTNLNMPTGTGLADQYAALADFQDKIKEVETWFEENPWVESIAKGIKGIYNFVHDNWDILKYVFGAVAIGAIGIKIIAGLSGVATAIGSLASVGGIATAGTGLAGLAGLLSFIAGIGLITLTLKAKAEFDDIKKGQAKVKDIKKNFDYITANIRQDLDLLSNMPKKSKEYADKVKEIKEKWDVVNSNLQLGDEELLNNIDSAKMLAETLSQFFDDDYYTQTLDLSERIGIERADEKARGFWDTWMSKLTGADNVRKQYINDMLKDFDGLKNKTITSYDDIYKSISKIFGESITIKLKANISEVVTKLKNIANTFEASGGLFGNVGSTIKKKLASYGYEKGLDYVPYDEYPALLHKGEAVVPAKYNPTIHSTGNEYTNSLLETLVIKMDDLAKRPNEFNIDGQKFANATYPLYEEQRNKQNYVEGVVVR